MNLPSLTTSTLHVTRLASVAATLILAASAVGWSPSANAQTAAPEPSAADKIKNAAKSAGETGGKAVDATKAAVGKAADAVTRTGEKIDANVPRTDAYKAKEAAAKPVAANAKAGDAPVVSKKANTPQKAKKKKSKARAKPAAKPAA